MNILDKFRVGACRYDASFIKKSVIEDHQSKYELWDTVYVMHENKVLETHICAIHIDISLLPHTASPKTCITYDLTDTDAIDLKDDQRYRKCISDIPESFLFATKEELLKTL